MAIPDFQSFMLPLLEFTGDGQVHTLAEARQHLAQRFNLTREDLEELLPSGTQPRFNNRVAWAKVYLHRALILDCPSRGRFCITDRGREVLAEKPDKIDVKYLRRFPEFTTGKKDDGDGNGDDENGDDRSPEEILESAYREIRSSLVAELLGQIKGASPQFFEKLVVELLVKMGYGGSREDAGRAVGRAGDEGIDGIIKEDRLGLDAVYIQAKRWEGTIGRPEIQKFVGALHGKRAKKGVFLTTGTFSREAEDYVEHIDPKIVLVDGQQLAGLMIDTRVGVSPVASYEVLRLDSDYFEEE